MANKVFQVFKLETIPTYTGPKEVFTRADETEYTQKNSADSAAEALADADGTGLERYIVFEYSKV